jgi:hypothetical protein
MRFNGRVDASLDGSPKKTTIEFSLYDVQSGGIPLWQETQLIPVDGAGHYSVMLGSASSDGLPLGLFTSNDARWLAFRINGEDEKLPRVMLVSVPYALKAADAETLGGKPLSAFLLADQAADSAAAVQGSGVQPNGAPVATSTIRAASKTSFSTVSSASSATPNYVPKFLDSATLTNSSLYDNGSAVAIGHTAPLSSLDVLGRVTYRAKGAESAGFWLMGRDGEQAFIGQLGLNAWDPVGVLHGGDWRMAILSDGRIGIGTTAPIFLLDVAGRSMFRGTYTDTPGFWLGDRIGRAQAFFGQAGMSPSDPVGIWHGGAWRVVFDSFGRMGLGTTTPQQVFDLTGRGLLRGTATDTAGLWLGDSSGRAQVFFGQVGLSQSDPVGIYHGGAWRFTVAANGSVGIGSSQPQTPLDVAGSSTVAVIRAQQNAPGGPGDISVTPPPAAMVATSTATTNSTAGVYASAASPVGAGIVGVNSAPTDWAVAMEGHVPNSPDGIAVYGEAAAPAGNTTGVYGITYSPDGYGIQGEATAATGVAIGVAGFSGSADGRGVLGRADSPSGSTYGVRGIADSAGGTGVSATAMSPTGQTVGLRAEVFSPQGAAVVATNFSGAGDLLIGRAADGTNVARIDGAGNAYFTRTNTGGADFAEAFAVRGPANRYTPGDVMSIDSDSHRRLRLSDQQYSRAVAGIYSTKPGVLARPRSVDQQSQEEEIPLAVIGVVPCKVSTKNGAIQPGDLLVSSDIPGYAMKGTEFHKMMGAVIGKALQSLETGSGLIDVLVTLQ